MENAISIIGLLGLSVAALIMVATGVFSILSLLWGDLLETDASDARPTPDLAEAA